MRDALMGLVANPRPFLVDTCYIYLFGVGRLQFEKNPLDPELLTEKTEVSTADSYSILHDNQRLKSELTQLQKKQNKNKKTYLIQLSLLFVGLILTLVLMKLKVSSMHDELEELKEDFSITPLSITKQEKEALEGIWICYTGSPQARISDTDRSRKVVMNIATFKEKRGYFLYKRYGASFNHLATHSLIIQPPSLFTLA